MTEEKKGFWARLKGSKKKASGCCSMQIEELPDDAPQEQKEEDEDLEEQKEEQAKKTEPAPCCGSVSTPRRGRGGNCCG